MSNVWKSKANLDSLEAKFLFSSYEEMRNFLDEVAAESEKREVHPNISFGRDYASLVIYPVDKQLGEREKALAEAIDQAYTRMSA